MKTAECEGVETVGAFLAEVCAARVVSVEPMGDSHNRQGCRGHRPLRPQDRGVRRPQLPPRHHQRLRSGRRAARRRPIGKIVTIGGVESDGMLASGAELGPQPRRRRHPRAGRGPGRRHPGLLPDSIIEIDNKSLTHRPDLWGHYGLAREVAALVDGLLRDPVKLDRLPAGPPPIGVIIKDFDLCPRYSALAFENVTIAPSPLWLQHRLSAIGLNPINNIVDVTNFVMAELAQPHARLRRRSPERPLHHRARGPGRRAHRGVE